MTTPWPIGLSTGCFYRQDICGVLPEIQLSGFRELEICSWTKHLDYHAEADILRARDMLRALELRPVSFHAPFADRIDITSLDDTVREAAVQELLTACRAAALLGSERIVLHPGPERTGRPPEHEFVRHMRHAAQSLNRVAACCCEEGIELLLENMLPHLLFGHTSDMLYLLGEISTCAVGTCLDTGHAFLSGDLGSVIHKLSWHLKMVHINDNRGDWDAHLIPGEGSIDWQWLIAELRHRNFQGPLIIEMSGGEQESVSDVLLRAQRGRDFLERLLLPRP